MMIFQHTWQKVLSGEKTQTRRIVKPLQKLNNSGSIVYQHKYADFRGDHRVVWGVGLTYAVQPARTKKAVGRIRLTGIRREDVREICSEDWEAEGFQDLGEFLEVWTAMHDPVIHHQFYAMLEANRNTLEMHDVWDMMIERIEQRPPELYQAWVLEFELAK